MTNSTQSIARAFDRLTDEFVRVTSDQFIASLNARKINTTTVSGEEAATRFHKWYGSVFSELLGQFGIGLTPVGYIRRMGTTGVLPQRLVDNMLECRGALTA